VLGKEGEEESEEVEQGDSLSLSLPALICSPLNSLALQKGEEEAAG
jgi:hypothetical protein